MNTDIEACYPNSAFALTLEDRQIVRSRIFSDPQLSAAISSDATSVRLKKQDFAGFRDENYPEAELIPHAEFLKITGLVDRTPKTVEKVFDRQWEQQVRWSNPTESDFLRSVHAAWEHEPIEIMLMTGFYANNLVARAIAVGSGEWISQEVLNTASQGLRCRDSLDALFLVHNHFNLYEQLMLPRNWEQLEGLVAVGGLSKSDVLYADKLQATFAQPLRIVMVAINGNGLTYSYVAGTSTHRDWMNESYERKRKSID